METKWTGALLVGGKSHRMGTDKLQLRLPASDSRPVVRVLDLGARVLRIHCQELLAVGEPRTNFRLEGFRHIPDEIRGAGPLAGIVTALEAASNPWVLVLAADLPCIDLLDLAALQRFAQTESDKVTWAVSPRGPEPLVAAYPRNMAQALRARLESGKHAVHSSVHNQSLRHWQAKLDPAAAKLSPSLNGLDAAFTNLNDFEDWNLLKKKLIN